MTCVLVLAAGHGWEPAALGHLEREQGTTVLRRCVDVDDLLAAATTGQADVAVVAIEAPGLDQPAVSLLRRHAVRVIGVSDSPATDPAVLETARRLSIDTLVPVAGLAALGEVVSRAEEHDGGDPGAGASALHPVAGEPGRDSSGRDSSGRSEPGRTIVVWGPAGAPGRTTVAVNLAAELARRSRPVVLADLDPYGGSVAQQLGVLDEVSGVLAGARLAAAGQLGERFGSVCREVEDGLVVLTGLPRADRWREVRPAHVDQLLVEATSRADVVVDAGFSLEDDALDLTGRGSRNAMTLGALEVADEIVVVGSADPVGLARLARSLVELHERFGATRTRVVVNRMRSSIGWSEREVAGMVEGFSRTAGLHFLPEDRPSIDRALVTGRAAVSLGESAFTRGVAALADAVLPASVAPASSRRGLRRRQAAKSR